MAELKIEEASRKVRELFDKGFAAMERGNLDYAIEMLLACLDLEPRLLQARKYLRASEIQKRRKAGRNPLVPLVAFLRGLPLYVSALLTVGKDASRALKTAERLMRLDPLNMMYIRLLARAAEAAGMPEVAVQTLEVAREIQPQRADVLAWLGNLYLEMGEGRKAQECFERLVDLRPNDPQAIKQLKDATALSTMQKGGWDAASSYRDVIKDVRQAHRLEQESKAVKTSRDIKDLIEEMRARIQREPDNVNHRIALAELMARAERYDEALEVLSEAQQGSGGADPQVDQMIADIRIKQMDMEIARLREAGDEDGARRREKERDAFVLEDAQERVKRYPNDLRLRYRLGVLLFEHGDLNGAIQQFQLSQRNPQHRLRSLYYLALCFKGKKQYDIAMEQLEKAASEVHTMDETRKDILYELGTLAELTGDKEKAAAYFKEIYAVDIGYKDVAEKIDKVYGR